MKMLSPFLALAAVGAAVLAFYVGSQHTAAFYAREGVATLTFQRVEFLRQFRDQIHETPRQILEAELATMTVHLDQMLHDHRNLFLDRDAPTYARDCALVYFHAFPFSIRLSDNSAEIIQSIGRLPDLKPAMSGLQEFHQAQFETDTTLANLLHNFDPALLHPTARRYYEKQFAKP